MRLYEEYMQRHGMKDLPVVRHAQFNILYVERTQVKSPCELTWRHMDIMWQKTGAQSGFFETQWCRSDSRPGRYLVSFSYFLPDSCQNNALKIKHYNYQELPWDKYEQFMMSVVQQLDLGQVYWEQRQLQLRAWEMFVAACDSFFSSQSGDVKYLLFHSLDQENSEDTRMAYLREVLKKISNGSPQLVRCWNDEIYQRLQNQSAWLVDLIGQQCKRNMRLLG